MTIVLVEIQAGLGVNFAKVAARFPGRSGQTNPSTIFRWATKGCRAQDGARVKLEFARIGTRLMTSEPAVERFLTALNAPVISEPQPRTPTQRNRAALKAAEALEAAGC
jgi:hypothetical protein